MFISVPAINYNFTESKNVMTIGKTCQLRANVGAVYGKPTNTKLKWRLEEAVINGRDRTDEVKDMGLITVSSKGKIAVSSKLSSRLGLSSYTSGYITVSVMTKDKTEHYDEVTIYLRKKVKTVRMSVLMSGGSEQEIGNEAIAVSQNKSITVYADYDKRPQTISVKSSDPNICGARISKITNTGNGYRVELKITGGMSAGNAVVTVKENGSGITRKVNIRVKGAE